jgi:flagellar protein FlaJ
MTFYDKLYWLMPKGYRKWVKQKLISGGIAMKPERYLGFSMFFSVMLGLVAFILALFFDLTVGKSALVGLVAVATFNLITVGAIYNSVDKRAKQTEEILPDALILMSSNIKSGLTPDRALLMSAREEFGPFGEEINKTAKNVIAGMTLQDALRRVTHNIESRILTRTIDLLEEGIKQGGSLVELLDTLASDIRQTKILKKEIKSFVLMYVIFIFFAVGIGAPLLFAISSYLVKTMTEMSNVLNVDEIGGLAGMNTMVKFSGLNIDTSFLTTYSVLALVVNSIFGGILIGVVQEGTGKGGFKYIPVLLAVSTTIYFLVKFVVSSSLMIF